MEVVRPGPCVKSLQYPTVSTIPQKADALQFEVEARSPRDLRGRLSCDTLRCVLPTLVRLELPRALECQKHAYVARIQIIQEYTQRRSNSGNTPGHPFSSTGPCSS